ncbi:uncharacterized protein LOC125063775 isoform X14 [Pieris napi]|uniref:uncharacterized protein LOC125063775 isoform X14 n=1 Tax=Pieris napi TaxID=78633 RepID=UPI001FBB8068|nr:uncharacterized protein LOC125063775 isoform X14 [Pieris napi]
MPDKNKKRKNNKNKRKNKGQHQPSNNNTRISTEACDQGPECIKKTDCSPITRDEITESQVKLVVEATTHAVTSNVDSEISTDLKELPKEIESSSAIPPYQSTSDAGIITKENTQLFEAYKVESPEKSIKSIPKLRSDIKSKSVDNDDRPIIVEIVEGFDKNELSSSLADSNNILITEFEPEVEWENTCEIKKNSYIEEENVAPGVLSVITLPLNVAECEEVKSMSPEEEKSLRQYLNTLQLSSNTVVKELEINPEIEQQVNHDIKSRLRKKPQAEESYSSMTGPARSLHVIDEEASGESSSVSRRHSYLIEKKSEDEELDDDVFYATNETKPEIKFRKGRKSNNLISQECIRVDAQLKNPEITEARGSWTTSTVEKITGAEIVYLTDSSSSTSSLYDNNDIEEKNDDSDVSVRIITPTIEVIDTDKFLKNDYNFNIVKSQVDHKINNNGLNDYNEKVNQNFDSNYSENEQNERYNKNISKENHEILVLSTDNINTNLFVKDVEKPSSEIPTSSVDTKKVVDNYDLEIKVLKCELNDAINNLIKEVVSETDATQEYRNDSLERQDSSSSVGSSQCTAKYNPKCSSLNDISMAEFDEIDKSHESQTHTSESKSHVKDVITNVQNINRHNIKYEKAIETPSLRDMCLEKISSLPYGEQILEELASVSERLQTLSDHAAPIGLSRITTFKDTNSVIQNVSNVNTLSRDKIVTPPAVQPRKSSLKINQDDTLKKNSIKSESMRYNCLSPSQKMLMETTNSLSHLKNTETSEHIENVENKNELSNPINKNTIDVPFKSQTGSRLLALLRNPSVATNSQKPKSNDDNISNIYERHTSQGHTISMGGIDFSVKPTREQSIHSTSNNLKPIPPPKPRKYSSSLYESDESSDFIDNSFKSVKNHKKYFHFSTGNLSQEIEDDISSIQNMHRHYNDMFRQAREDLHPRRPSLPKDLCDQQMEYIRQKEKEVEAEIYRLERERINTPQKRGPRAPMLNDEFESESFKSFNRIRNSQSHGVLPSLISPSPGKLSSVFSKSQEELLRNKMYSEYLSQMAEREERKQKKIIKITKTPCSSNSYSKSSSELTTFDSKVNNRIEKEFIDRAKDRWNKLGFKDPETEDEYDRNSNGQPKVIEHKIKVIDSGEEKDVQKLPSHLQDFVKFRAKDKSVKSESPETVMIAPTFKARSTSPAVWTPGAQPPAGDSGSSAATPPVPPPPPVWTPNSATASPQTPRKTFRPVHFEESPPARRKFENKEPNGCMSGSEGESRLRTSHSAPVTGFNSLGSKLPKAPNPTVTLLQKAREGQLSRASQQVQGDSNSRLPRDRPSPPFGDPIHALRRGYVSEGEGERRERNSTTKMADTQKKIEGIGPITNDGMPVTLRSEVKDPSKWYKKMYDTIHKNKYDNDYVTIRYKSRRDEPQRVSSSKSQYAYFDPRSGYLSEPEGGLSRLTSGTWSDAYDSDVTSGPRRRTASVQEDRRNDITSPYLANNKYSTLASTRVSQEVYKSQPGKIENYTPGKSSVVDKEAKQQNMSNTTMSTTSLPKEKKDITSAILSKSNMARALKESGYESDSTLVFKRREETEGPLSPAERRAAYRDLQAGGEPPLRGFRSPAPPRTEESEIEYIPISSTLTKIRIHKKSPSLHEVICYPVTRIETDQRTTRKGAKDVLLPPPPPRRVSSRSSRTLQLVTISKPKSVSPKRVTMPSNVDLIKEKISSKLNRQNTHLILKSSETTSIVNATRRNTSNSAPPALSRHKSTSLPTCKEKNKVVGVKQFGTSSFGSPRKTIQPTEYSTPSRCKYGTSPTSIIIEGGAGRKTPITSILDKVTPIDKLWGSQKRNEQIDLTKLKGKCDKNMQLKISTNKPSSKSSTLTAVTHRSRDMIRTSEKVQKLKSYAQSTPCLVNKRDDRQIKTNIKTLANVSKSSSNICNNFKKANIIKTNEITNKSNKKSLETVFIKPKAFPSHEKGNKNKPKVQKVLQTVNKNSGHKKKKGDSIINEKCSSQFGDDVNEIHPEENLSQKHLHVKEIKAGRDAIMSDSFFQHLFFQNAHPMPVSTVSDSCHVSTVKEKARMFQSNLCTGVYYTPSAVNTYLIHRKPVSLSRFKMWDKNDSPSSIPSPRSISWPGRMDGKIKKFDSLLKCQDDYGSSMSLSTIRSNSEPPTNKLYFSQTSRPKSPVIIFHKNQDDKDSKSFDNYSLPSKMVHEQALHASKSKQCLKSKASHRSNTVSATPVRLVSKSDDYDLSLNYPPTIFFSQTSRPISPKVFKKPSTPTRSQSSSPISIRSPSYRRINNVKSQQKANLAGTRPRSVDIENKNTLPSLQTRSKSDTLSQNSDPEYEEYMQDIENNKNRSERFRELNRYYTYLERVGELEKAASITDLRHRRKDEEIIDFDRWKKIRAIERAEEELNSLYEKLKIAQTEKDFLFYPRDIKDFRWKFEKERGLKVKEKSVEDLKDDLLQKSSYCPQDVEPNQKKDVYKPLWRGKSVAETAFSINKKNECKDISNTTSITKPSLSKNTDLSIGELRKKIGIGNRLWSSLSLDQVNALKSQLNAIYSKEIESKSQKEINQYTVEVKERDKNYNSNLHVRCSSLSTTPTHDILKELNKSKSIAAICPVPSEKDIKNNVNNTQMSLSETEKKQISQTLSKEVIRRINTKSNSEEYCEKNSNEIKDTCNLLATNKRHVVYASDKEELPSSASETETGGSDKSNNTVIFVAPKKEVQKKVEYFESIKKLPHSSAQIENSIPLSKPMIKSCDISSPGYISQSQSCTNIKELFGESDKNKFLSLPSKPDLYSRSSSPYSDAYICDKRSPDSLRFSSDETIWRSRSPSPDPERYWRAFLKLARAGEVRRLARRFDTLPVTSAVIRRHRSDPEINNIGLRNCLCTGKSARHRERCKTSYTVARVPLRSTNRFMPHIDIISKLAALRRRTAPRSRSAEEALECRPGEVERIRKRFEVMSLLGQIYSSAPDVSELKDIAPYLEGPWVAHRYPKPSDNNRSVSDTKNFVRGQVSPVKKEIKKPIPKAPLKLNSILKSDGSEGQEFNPSAHRHRPISRYEPPRSPARPPPAEWPYKLAPFVTPSRHNVKFEETDSTPEPPRRMPQSSFSDSESPSRRYVESDVNIHYRCPVRHDPLPLVPERELARQQAEHMKRLYREQKRNKYLQENDYHPIDIEAFDASIKELQDMQSRRHQDNFMPSQKTIVPLNRYDEADRVVARALYTFNGQTGRELSFRKGDIINVRRQIDNNWYEGEFHGRIGLFPYNYVELLKGDVAQSPKKPVILEGRARAKFDFTAQTNLELPLKKGELVVLARRIDHNWWEGRVGNKTGIFPDSYVTILQEPSQGKPEPQPILSTDKPVASPAAHGVVNGDKRSLGAHTYIPQHNSAALGNAPPATEPLIGYPAKGHSSPADRGLNASVNLNNTEPLYVDTNAEAVPYRAMYKYRPQNPDELELNEGDTVYVLEKCDDGWYVGSSQRTGRFGTFPGNYVERI